MKNIFKILTLLFFTTSLNAQTAREYLSPVASPQASVSQNVGMTNITIKYSSPGVKGRTIFGDLVPYNELWRAGANSPTIIEFSTDVKIGEKTIRAGDYAIAMTPRKNGKWTVDLNKEGKYPFAYRKDGKINIDAYSADLAHSFDTEVVIWDSNIERLTYFIDANNNKVANINMLWENVIVTFQVNTMPKEFLKNFTKTLE